MRDIYPALAVVALVQASAGCTNGDDAAPGYGKSEAGVDASGQPTASHGAPGDASTSDPDASSSHTNWERCTSPEYPEAGTPCSGNLRCTMPSPDHIDCDTPCPPGCSGGGLVYIPISPPRAECINELWVVHPSDTAGASCANVPVVSCDCPDNDAGDYDEDAG